MKVLHFFMIFLLLFLISCDNDNNNGKDFTDSDFVDSDIINTDNSDDDLVDIDEITVDQDASDVDFTDSDIADEDVIDNDIEDEDINDEDIDDSDISPIEIGENGCYNIKPEHLGNNKFVLKTTDYGSGISSSVLEKEIPPIFWTDNKEDKFVIEFWEKTVVGSYDLASTLNFIYEDAEQRVALYNSEDNCDELTGTDFENCINSPDYFLFQRSGTLEVLEGDSFNENLFAGRITNLILYDVTDPSDDDDVEALDGGGCYNFPTIEWIIKKSETFDCNLCSDWEECNAEKTACVNKEGRCGEDLDCSENADNITDCDIILHKCIFNCSTCTANQTCDLENKQCVKINYCESNPCVGNTDSGMTKCSDLENSYLCGCEDGFYGKDGKCLTEDACNPANPCTEEHKTVCNVENNTPKCTCDIGFVDNGSGICVTGGEPACAANLSEITIGTDFTNENEIVSENSYNPKGHGCLESNGAPGNDVMYKFKLNSGEKITITVEDPYFNGVDYAIYVLDTCESSYSCIVGADDEDVYSVEKISFTAPKSGTYYLVIDQFMQNSNVTSFTITTSVE